MLTSMTDEEITRNNLTRKDIYKLAREVDNGKSTIEKKPELRIVEPTKNPEVVKTPIKDLSDQWLKIDSRKREDLERNNDVNWGDVKAGDRYFDLDSRQYVIIEKKFNKHANATTEDGKKIKVLSYLTQKQSFEDMATDALVGIKKPDLKPVDSVAKTKEEYVAQKVKELQKPIEQRLSKLSKSLEDSEFERIKGTKEQPRRSDIIERYPRTDEQKNLVGQLGIARKELSKVESNENQLKLQANYENLNTKKPDLKVVEPTKKPQEQTDTKKPDLKVVDGGKGVEPDAEFLAKFPKWLQSGENSKIINTKKGTKIPIPGMMGEGEVIRVNAPTKARPYGSITVKPTKQSIEDNKKAGFNSPKQETFDLIQVKDHIKKTKPNFSEFTWTRENIEYFKNFKTPCNQTLSYR